MISWAQPFSVDNEDSLEAFEKDWAGYAYSVLL